MKNETLVMEAERTLSNRFSTVSGSVLLNYSELAASIEASDEEKAKNLLSYLVNMRLKMKEDLTAVDGTKFTLDLSVKENLSYI